MGTVKEQLSQDLGVAKIELVAAMRMLILQGWFHRGQAELDYFESGSDNKEKYLGDRLKEVLTSITMKMGGRE